MVVTLRLVIVEVEGTMTRQGRRAGLAVIGAALATLVASAPAYAAEGRDFAEHVRACQQDMGFTGAHNPGVMHQGLSGWDPSHTC